MLPGKLLIGHLLAGELTATGRGLATHLLTGVLSTGELLAALHGLATGVMGLLGIGVLALRRIRHGPDVTV
ncbi:hypothetical protein GCM10009702_10280 [Propioniferax innocua]